MVRYLLRLGRMTSMALSGTIDWRAWCSSLSPRRVVVPQANRKAYVFCDRADEREYFENTRKRGD